MPPKRKAGDRERDSDKAESRKKPKVAESELAPNGQPTNKGIPDDLVLPPRVPGTIRIAAWNVCGLAASQKKVQKFFWRRPDSHSD
jgi:AP endonuclease 1